MPTVSLNRLQGEARPRSFNTVPDSRVVQLVRDRRDDTLRSNAGFYGGLTRWYDVFKGVWKGHLGQFRNHVQIPFIFSVVMADVARKAQTSFGGWPIVSFEGYAPEDRPRAKKNELLVSAQMKDDQAFRKGVDFFLSADLYGTAILRYGWKNVTRKHRIRLPERVAPGRSVERVFTYQAEHFNGPTFKVVDPMDFWPAAGYVLMQDLAYATERYYRDLDTLMEENKAQRDRGETPYFDLAGLQELARMGTETSGDLEYGSRRLSYRSPLDEAQWERKLSKPVEIWEMHGLVPSEFALDGIRNRRIAVGNGRALMANRESAFPDGEIPFLAHSPLPDPHRFWGIGKVAVAEGPQLTANRIANQKLDALDLLIDPMLIVNSQVNLNVANLYSRAGRVITVDGPVDDTQIRPLTLDMRGIQNAYAEIGQLWQFIQLGAGINETVLGLGGGDRETARGVLARQENILTRLAMEARLAEEEVIEPLGNAFRQLDRWFLPLPHEAKILGSIATTNPVTGLPYPKESLTVDFDDFTPDYRARAVGATQMMGRSVRQQNSIALLQIMSSNPVLLKMVNWANFAREMFDLFGFSNVEEFLVSQVPQVNQLAEQNGQSPEQMAEAASQPLNRLSPETLGQLFDVQGAAAIPATNGFGF